MVLVWPADDGPMRKSLASFTLVASLATGAGAALLFAPALAGAAQDAEESDDTAADDHESKLADVLQPLVDDGTITDEQRDAVVDTLIEARPDRGDRHGKRGHGPFGRHGRGHHTGAVAEILGLDPAELRAELRDGNTLADIAEAQGVEIDAVVDAVVERAEERLATAVENGRLTEAEAADKLDEIRDRITDRIAD